MISSYNQKPLMIFPGLILDTQVLLVVQQMVKMKLEILVKEQQVELNFVYLVKAELMFTLSLRIKLIVIALYTKEVLISLIHHP